MSERRQRATPAQRRDNVVSLYSFFLPAEQYASMPTGFQEQKTSESALSKREHRMKLTPSQETSPLTLTHVEHARGTKIAGL